MNTITAQFSNPKEQFNQLLAAFNNHFPAHVADEITAFVYKMRDDKYDVIQQIVDNRFNRIKELTQKNDPKLDRKMRVILFIEKTNPNDLAKDIRSVISLDSFFDEYERFIETLASRDHGKVFLKYQLDPQLKQFIQSGIYSAADKAMKALEEYTRSIKEFADLLHKIKNSVGEKAFLRMGASILGGMAAGVVGSIIAREITSSLTSDEDKIIQSTNQIFIKWEQFLDVFDDLVRNYEYGYLHIVATLFGGTLLSYDKGLRKANLHIDQLSMGEYNFSVRFTEVQLHKLRSWAENSVNEIKSYIKQRNRDKALYASSRFYQAVQGNSVLREVPYSEQYSLIYMANMYKYAALVMKAVDLKANDEVAFLAMITEIYKQMPYMVYDNDLKALDVPEQTDIILEWICLSLKHGQDHDLRALLDYGLSMLGRNVNIEFYNGEQGYGHGAIDLETILYVLAHFLNENQKYEHSLIQRFTDHKYFPGLSSLTELQKRYSAFSSKDAFYKFVTKVFRLTASFNTLKPVLRRKSRRLLALTLLLLLVGYLGYSQQDKIHTWLMSFKQDAAAEAPSILTEDEDTRHLIVTTDQANIRVEPSLNSEPVIVVNQHDRLEYADEEREDNDGRLWYKVIISGGRIGWISSKTVQWTND